MTKNAAKVVERNVILDEFAKGITPRDTKAGFVALMRSSKDTAPRPQVEWERLLTLFKTRPVSVPWSEWVKKGGK